MSQIIAPNLLTATGTSNGLMWLANTNGRQVQENGLERSPLPNLGKSLKRKVELDEQRSRSDFVYLMSLYLSLVKRSPQDW